MGGDFSQKNVDCSKGIYALTGKILNFKNMSISKISFLNAILYIKN